MDDEAEMSPSRSMEPLCPASPGNQRSQTPGEIAERRVLKLGWVHGELTRMRGQVRAQKREIEMLTRAGIDTAAARALLERMGQKVARLSGEHDQLREG